MQETKRSARRNHALELKKSVLDECRAGASVAGVAMAHGLNANLVHKWRRLERSKVVAAATPPIPAQTFIPLVIASPTVTAPTCAEPRELRIEIRRDDQLADVGHRRVRRVAARTASMIRIDALWLATQPVDMRAGAGRLLARVVQVFGCAQAQHGYLFANARADRKSTRLNSSHVVTSRMPSSA